MVRLPVDRLSETFSGIPVCNLWSRALLLSFFPFRDILVHAHRPRMSRRSLTSSGRKPWRHGPLMHTSGSSEPTPGRSLAGQLPIPTPHFDAISREKSETSSYASSCDMTISTEILPSRRAKDGDGIGCSRYAGPTYGHGWPVVSA